MVIRDVILWHLRMEVHICKSDEHYDISVDGVRDRYYQMGGELVATRSYLIYVKHVEILLGKEF